ncbi:probable F-box protein At5g04010 [Euphorbia lathyris]|uniref:probable F-box protein At5g04010 n=1 Tax=Euphorbia lathyris TaxID=212925 RepID=UPI003313BB72
MFDQIPPHPRPPSWEVLILIAHHLDPITLALASCVSKSWYISMSSDHIWNPLCSDHFPSISQLKLTNPTISYHRLYAMGYTAAKRRRKTPKKPLLSLHNLLFVINICFKTGRPIINVAKPGSSLLRHKGLFRFDIDVDCGEGEERPNSGIEEEVVVVSWNVVLEGWSAVFTVMECEGKVGLGHGGGEGWFSAELPSPGCWGSETMSGVVGDLKLSFSEGKGVIMVNKEVEL